MVFESVEKSVTQLMQKCICDEYAHISSKREQGISDLKEERRVRCELQLPEFNGRNLEDWVLQLEDSFHFFQLNEETKLKAAIIGLDGKALQWFEREHRWLPFRDWQELKTWLLRNSGRWLPNKKERSEKSLELLEKESIRTVVEVVVAHAMAAKRERAEEKKGHLESKPSAEQGVAIVGTERKGEEGFTDNPTEVSFQSDSALVSVKGKLESPATLVVDGGPDGRGELSGVLICTSDFGCEVSVSEGGLGGDFTSKPTNVSFEGGGDGRSRSEIDFSPPMVARKGGDFSGGFAGGGHGGVDVE